MTRIGISAPMRRGTSVLAFILASSATVGAQRAPARSSLASLVELLNAEDSRDTSAPHFAPIARALGGPDPLLRAHAVRALGRFERLEFVARLVSFLDDSVAAVRIEAANALGQTAQRVRSGPAAASTLRAFTEPLFAAAAREQNPRVRGVLAITLGRMLYRVADDVGRAEDVLHSVLDEGARRGDVAEEAAGARALELLIRRRGRLRAPSEATVTALRVASRAGAPASHERASPVWVTPYPSPLDDRVSPLVLRRSAGAALVAAGKVDSALVDEWQRGEPEMRRLAVLGATRDSSARERARRPLQIALGDPVFEVRFEALRAYAKLFPHDDCEPLVHALADTNVHVAVLAADLIGVGCSSLDSRKAVATIVARTDADSRSWQQRAHALVALARIDSAAARPQLPHYATERVWQLRMYAARAAAELGDQDMLRRLAADSVANVRNAAVEGLARTAKHAADDVYIRALSGRDYQLVLTAAQSLKGTAERGAATAALLDALDTLTRAARETSRDPRLAILARLNEVGDSSSTARLLPYLTDFDVAVADSAASLLTRWTGTTATAAPRPLVKAPLTVAELAELRRCTLRVTMAGGGTFDVRLFADEAPFTARRMVALARAHFYDGIAFHRVEPNFVIQGPSPGDNEYTGDGPFMRDEIWLRMHSRGTIGISARGRDTGDAQWFVNLVDDPLLDFEFTIGAAVTSGMPVVSGVVEGDVVQRIVVVKH